MPIKLLYVVSPTSCFAGVERVIDEVCSEMATKHRSEFDVDVLFMTEYPGVDFSERPYRLIQRNTKGKFDILKCLRETIFAERYDLVIVPQVEMTTVAWFACLGRQQRIAAYLHGNPRLERTHIKAKILFWLMQVVVLPRLTAIFGVAPKQLAAFKTMYPSEVPHYWVPNPVREFDTENLDVDKSGEAVTFVNVGRYDYQKGQDILITAFARLAADRPNTRLVLVGYGSDEQKLKDLISELNMESRVFLENHPVDPGPALAAADAYVATSRWEGWGLSICEALRFGLPIVATDCEFGPSDIISDDRVGQLVPQNDQFALVNAMADLCDHIQEIRLDASFRREYVKRFNVENVVHDHAAAIVDALSKSGASMAASPFGKLVSARSN